MQFWPATTYNFNLPKHPILTCQKMQFWHTKCYNPPTPLVPTPLISIWLSLYLHNEGTQASQKFSEVLRPLLRSSQNIYKMAASKKPNLANYPFGAASPPQKGGLDSLGFFESTILYMFWELLRKRPQKATNFWEPSENPFTLRIHSKGLANACHLISWHSIFMNCT